MDWNSAIHRECYPDAVRRYVLTYKAAGTRVLFGAAQGRHTYETPEDAAQYLAAVLRNNSAELLARYPDLQVRACACWAGHFDPCGIYFEDDTTGEIEPAPEEIPGGPRGS